MYLGHGLWQLPNREVVRVDVSDAGQATDAESADERLTRLLKEWGREQPPPRGRSGSPRRGTPGHPERRGRPRDSPAGAEGARARAAELAELEERRARAFNVVSDAAVAMPSIITAKALIAILESVAVLSFRLDQVEQEDGDRFAREIAADRDRVRITSVRRARAGLTRSSRKTAADPLPTASHSQPARVEVHILPAEAQRLAEAEAESESHLTERLQPIALDGRQEALRLLRREGLDRLPLGMDSVDQSAATLRRR